MEHGGGDEKYFQNFCPNTCTNDKVSDTGKKMTLKIVLQMPDVTQWTGFMLLRIRFSVWLLEHGFLETVGVIVQH